MLMNSYFVLVIFAKQYKRVKSNYVCKFDVDICAESILHDKNRCLHAYSPSLYIVGLPDKGPISVNYGWENIINKSIQTLNVQL